MGVATGTVDASVIPGTAKVEIIGLLGPSPIAVSGTSGSFDAFMATGTQDVALVALDSRNYMLAVRVVRSQIVPGMINSGNTIVFLASDALGLPPFTVTNTAGFPPSPGFAAGYMTADGTFIRLFSSTAAHYPTISSAESQPGDYYTFTANNFNQAFTQFTGTSQTTSTAGAITLPLPAQPLAYSAPTPATFPNFNLSYAGFAGDTAVSYWADIGWAASVSIYTITVAATAAYQNGATTLAVPNLTGLSGFLPSASSGTTVNWHAGVYGGTYQRYAPTPVNSSLSFAASSSTFVEP